jgi:CheY-like chemotaxis protein
VRTVRLVIGDNHETVAHGPGIATGNEPDLEVVGTTASVADCLSPADERTSNVVMMDLRLGDGDGLEAIGRLRTASPDINVIMLAANPDDVGAHMCRVLRAYLCHGVQASIGLTAAPRQEQNPHTVVHCGRNSRIGLAESGPGRPREGNVGRQSLGPGDGWSPRSSCTN